MLRYDYETHSFYYTLALLILCYSHTEEASHISQFIFFVKIFCNAKIYTN